MNLWERVRALIDRAPSLDDLRAHGLLLFAAHAWLEAGRDLEGHVAEELRQAEINTLLAPLILKRLRETIEGPIVVFKGPEVAAHYPKPTQRRFVDIDVLVPNVERAQEALLADDFRESPDPSWAARRRDRRLLFEEMHHARPIYHPELPLKLELHRWPSWPRWLVPPAPDALFASTIPSSLGVDGIATLAPSHHAVVLAAHSWVHRPLGRVSDLVDVAALAAETDRDEIEDVARSWNALHLWRSTIATVDAVLGDRRPTLAQRLWANNLGAVRERTVLENHLESWLSPFWTLPPPAAARQAFANLLWDFRPSIDEPWSAKVKRIARAAANARLAKSVHDLQLGPDARQMQSSKKWRRRPGPGERG